MTFARRWEQLYFATLAQVAFRNRRFRRQASQTEAATELAMSTDDGSSSWLQGVRSTSFPGSAFVRTRSGCFAQSDGSCRSALVSHSSEPSSRRARADRGVLFDRRVFSLDRAMQLDRATATIRRHAAGLYASPAVLYQSSDHEFAAGYEISVTRTICNVQWVGETDLHEAKRVSILTSDGSIGLSITDDDIYFFDDVAPFDLLEHEVCFRPTFGPEHHILFSLRRLLPSGCERPIVAARRLLDWRERRQACFRIHWHSTDCMLMPAG